MSLQDAQPIGTVSKPGKVCSICGIYKDSGSFYKSNNGLRSLCKTCQLAANDTPITYLRNMWGTTKLRSIRRAGPTQNPWTFQQVVEKWNRQQHKCYISGMPMKTSTFTDWQASPERLNNDIGYENSNVVLVCAEFNTQNQWTREKFHKVFVETIDAPHDPIVFPDELFTKTRKSIKGIPRPTIVVREDGFVRCNKCMVFKERDHYTNTRDSRCPKCLQAISFEYEQTWLGALKRLVQHTKINGDKCARKKGSVTLEELIEMLRQQGGLCAYLCPVAKATSKCRSNASTRRKAMTKRTYVSSYKN
jgi:ferredoxin